MEWTSQRPGSVRVYVGARTAQRIIKNWKDSFLGGQAVYYNIVY